ncbi:MAG: cytochrome c3 family protein [Desulfuromonadia bacterium]
MNWNRLIITLFAILIHVSGSWGKETKDVKFTFTHADPVIFSHDIHLAKYNNNCRICHNAIFNLKNRRHFTMAEMEKTRSCGACHTGVKAFSVADDRSCTRCHAGKPKPVVYTMKGATDVTFSHEIHIAKTGGKCRSCHASKAFTRKRGVTMAEMAKGATCGSCHNDRTAFTVQGNCGRCHKGMTPRTITFSVPAGNATFSHSLHLKKYTCTDCHTKIFPYRAGASRKTMADMEKGLSCGACHNGKTAFSSASDCGKCHESLKPGVVTFKNPGGLATFSHEVHLKKYSCGSCHPKIFSFTRGKSSATMDMMSDGKSCGACHDGKTAFSVKDECGACHQMGGK